MFGWDFEVDAWSRFWRWSFIKICVWTCDMTPKVTLARWTQSSGPLCLWQCFSQNFHFVNQPTIWEAEKNAAEQKSKDERPEVECGYCSLQTYSFHRLIIFSIFHNTRLICWRLHHNWFSSLPLEEVVCLDSKYKSPYVWLWEEKRDSQRVPVYLKTNFV